MRETGSLYETEFTIFVLLLLGQFTILEAAFKYVIVILLTNEPQHEISNNMAFWQV